jgi:hypothetical protein
MVAEAVLEEPKRSIKRPGRKPGGICQRIPLATRIKARNLYVLQQLQAEEVAKQVGLRRDQVYSLADREGWTKARSEIKRKAIEAADARIAADTSELVEAVAMESAELTLSTFAAAKAELAAGPGEFTAKNVQAYSQATKNYVGLYRQAKSLDVAAQQGSTVNVMFVSCPRAGDSVPVKAPSKAEPINVTPAKPTDA